MSPVREIVTLQFGNYANHVGAHWWNIQESGFNYESEAESGEISHDVLYREGINHNRQTTFTPRLLLVDLDGSLKHLSKEGELYGNSIKRSNDNGDVQEDPVKKLRDDLEFDEENIELVKEPIVPKNKFQEDLDKAAVDVENHDYNLSENVDSWADYLYPRFHPRTMNIVKNFRHNSEKESLDTFSLGIDLWNTEQFQEDFCDKIRQYVEESDYLQGFQTIFDGFNGFGGLAVKCLEHLNDEYGKANFAIPVYSPKNVIFDKSDQPTSDAIKTINSALIFNELIEQSSLFVPLSLNSAVWKRLGPPREFKNLNYQAANNYQTSAILASYLDTISLRYRLKDGSIGHTLSAFCADMTHHQRKLAGAGISIPFPMNHNEDLIDCLDRFEGDLFHPLTPNCEINKSYVTQSICVRGIPKYRLKRAPEHAKLQMRMAAYKCSNVSEMFQLYLQCSYHSSMAHVTAISQPLPTRLPYPGEIFAENIDKNGFLNPFNNRSSSDKVNSIPTLATIQSSKEIAQLVQKLHAESSSLKSTKLYRFKAAGMENDDFSEALENLLSFTDRYDDGWDL